MTLMRKISSLSDAIEAVRKVFITDHCIIDKKVGSIAFSLERNGVTTTLGCIHDSDIQELAYLDSKTRNILARNVVEIVQYAVAERCPIPIPSDMQPTVV